VSAPEEVRLGLEHLQGAIGLPPKPEYYIVSRKELEQLDDMARNPQLDLFWGLLGLFLGTIIPAIGAFHKIASFVPLDAIDTVYLFAFIASFAAGLTLLAFGFGRKSRHEKLIEDIKSRPKVPLKAVSELD
jgi:hypothetical protein